MGGCGKMCRMTRGGFWMTSRWRPWVPPPPPTTASLRHPEPPPKTHILLLLWTEGPKHLQTSNQTKPPNLTIPQSSLCTPMHYHHQNFVDLTHSNSSAVALNHYTIINATLGNSCMQLTQQANKWNNYHMAEHTHFPRSPCSKQSEQIS